MPGLRYTSSFFDRFFNHLQQTTSYYTLEVTMRKKRFFSLNEFISSAHPTDDVVDFTITTKHHYLFIKTIDNEYLIKTEQYKKGSFMNTGVAYTLHAIVNNKEYAVSGIIEILGFRDFNIALRFCTARTDCLCSKPENKLIFSPQLARYLLRHDFRIVDLKEKNDDSGDVVFVFLVEEGFYECIDSWKKLK